MLTFSSLSSGGATLSGDKIEADVFPKESAKGRWALLANPEEDLTERVISWPGEYDFDGMTLRAIGQDQGRQVSYSATIDGVRCAFIAAPVLEWSDTDIEGLGDIDVLLIAADNPKKVTAIVEAVDPRVVILFKVKDGDLPGVLKSLGGGAGETVESFKVKTGSMPAEGRQVVVLK